MTRSYKGIKLKKDRVYSVEQLIAVYSVTANTVSNWVGEGLEPSDSQRPYLFRGAVVQEFHSHKRIGLCRKLLSGQFFCRGCQSEVFPAIETVQDFTAQNGKHMYSAKCSECASKLQKISGKTDRDKVEDCRNPNTPTEWLHEEKASIRGGIGIKAEKDIQIFHSKNDRLIYKWQSYAGGNSEKTIDRHLASIRFFEKNLEGKYFATLSTNDFAKVRDELKRRACAEATDSLSASTIKHKISHLIAFFDWLVMQDGFRRLPRDFAGYLKLPRAVVAGAAQVKQKEYPNLAEAEKLLNAMPSKSLVDQRRRAIFALAFLGALRADTLASLLIKHVNTQRRLIIQDAGVVRTKAGKSVNIRWFHIPESFEMAIVKWLEKLQWLGFTGADALFPDT